MLAGAQRFHSRGGVQATRSVGKKNYGREITAVYAPNGRGKTRIAVVVSKKVLKSAVGRNRIRRRVYEAARLALPLRAPTDVLLLVQTEAVKDLPWEELREKVQQILESVV
jgi:ribonuclease P protein component